MIVLAVTAMTGLAPGGTAGAAAVPAAVTAATGARVAGRVVQAAARPNQTARSDCRGRLARRELARGAAVRADQAPEDLIGIPPPAGMTHDRHSAGHGPVARVMAAADTVRLAEMPRAPAVMPTAGRAATLPSRQNHRASNHRASRLPASSPPGSNRPGSAAQAGVGPRGAAHPVVVLPFQNPGHRGRRGDERTGETIDHVPIGPTRSGRTLSVHVPNAGAEDATTRPPEAAMRSAQVDRALGSGAQSHRRAVPFRRLPRTPLNASRPLRPRPNLKANRRERRPRRPLNPHRPPHARPRQPHPAVRHDRQIRGASPWRFSCSGSNPGPLPTLCWPPPTSATVLPTPRIAPCFMPWCSECCGTKQCSTSGLPS